jgi:DNA-binding MarR family transcriptional regulator
MATKKRTSGKAKTSGKARAKASTEPDTKKRVAAKPAPGGAGKRGRVAASEPVVRAIDASELPLFTLLSFVLVAFTIEFDNEAEHRMAHTTTAQLRAGDLARGPWLTSLAMYENCMKHLGKDGVRVGDLERLAKTGANLAGMTRWGYVTIAPDPSDKQAGTRAKIPERDWIIRATPAGRRALEVWAPLHAEIERRWELRFGAGEMRELHEALGGVWRQIDRALPDCMPILGYGLVNRVYEVDAAHTAAGEALHLEKLTLVAAVSRVLLAFALEFEEGSMGSLAIGANVLRVLTEEGVAARDLPVLSGVSKESIAMAMGILKKYELVEEFSDARVKMVRLTAKGSEVKERAKKLVESIEARWSERFGHDAMRRLRGALETIVRAEGAEPDAHGNASHLFAGMKPYPEGWRAAVKAPRTLPHFPMVLHRGGYPDGS